MSSPDIITPNASLSSEYTDVTAMDLGTSNTCITFCAGGKPVVVLKPEGWQHASLGGAIPSLVLYRQQEGTHTLEPFLIGAAAELEFGEASPSEKRHYSLRARFKPDIAAQDDARQWMLDFLLLLRSRVHICGKVLVGIPCQADNHYQQVLRQCLAQSGWEDVRFLREPMGALVHYIAAGILPPSVAARGVLTIDFGGGTCDLAVMRRADVLSWHGDMLYGGRLFDDLFFQMLLAQNPGLAKQLEREGNSYYVHWVASRRAKEDFSAAMAQDKSQAVTVRTRWSNFDGQEVKEHSAYIEHLTWTDFLLRAGNYQASESLRASLQEHSGRAGLSPMAQGLLQGQRVDLITWFEQILTETLRLNRTAPDKEHASGGLPPTVLLTGGSSAWPFVEDLVHQLMGSQVRVLRGDEPYADIAKGLAQYHVLAQRLSVGRQGLQQELPAFMAQNIAQQAIRRNLEEGIDRLLVECCDFLRSVVLLPEFHRFRAEGGPLRGLLDGIAAAVQREDPRLRQLLDDAMQRMALRITESCRTSLKAWFRDKGIPIVPERLEQRWLGGSLDEFLQSMATELSKNTLASNRNAAAIATMVAGPGLAALTVSGLPLVALGVGIGSLVAMKFLKLDTWLADATLMLSVPGLVRHRMFSDSRISSQCDSQLEAFSTAFREQLLTKWAKSEAHILEEATRVAREEINALDLLNITPS